ncbi:hypothetical protein [Aquipuribacter sp. SD81]|uniref:hypothetical protein n=1 Tax=Aquipuribacter sp. SD81 TaxID=3127703 RepID=UPI0030178D68
MGRRGGAVLAVTACALAVAVVLVRPGTEVAPDELAGPTPPSTPPSPSSAPPEPTATYEPLTRPLELGALTLADIAPTTSGAGPLVLGAPEAALAASGWTTVAGEDDGCRRVREAVTSTGDVLTGWVRDGRLVSVQVTAGAAELDLPRLGLAFGRPVEEVRSAGRLAVSGSPDAEVKTVTSPVADGVEALASDLGTPGIRWVEVRLPPGGDCVLDGRTADGSLGPVELDALSPPAGPEAQAPGEVSDAVARLQPLLGAAPGDDVLTDAGYLTASDADPGSCTRVGLAGARPGEAGATWVDVAGGEVVRAGLTLLAGRPAADPGPVPGPVPGSPGERTLVRTSTLSALSSDVDGGDLAVETETRLTAWLPPGVDAFAATSAPVVRAVAVVREGAGVVPGCSSLLP